MKPRSTNHAEGKTSGYDFLASYVELVITVRNVDMPVHGHHHHHLDEGLMNL